jgi:hypothetical protein
LTWAFKYSFRVLCCTYVLSVECHPTSGYTYFCHGAFERYSVPISQYTFAPNWDVEPLICILVNQLSQFGFYLNFNSPAFQFARVMSSDNGTRLHVPICARRARQRHRSGLASVDLRIYATRVALFNATSVALGPHWRLRIAFWLLLWWLQLGGWHLSFNVITIGRRENRSGFGALPIIKLPLRTRTISILHGLRGWDCHFTF